jgi:transcriptional regulator with XRE-family HTH domain
VPRQRPLSEPEREWLAILGKNIRARLDQLDMRQVDLCRATKIPQGVMSDVLAGRRSIRLDTLLRIADALAITPGRLFSRTWDAEPDRIRAKKRARRLAEVVGPLEVPQARRSLPSPGAIRVNDDGTKIQCHVCGKWLGALPVHLRTHGMTAEAYKEQFGLARTTSLWSPVTQEKQRIAAEERGQGEVGRQALIDGDLLGHGRPKGIRHRTQTRVRKSQEAHGKPKPPRTEGKSP